MLQARLPPVSAASDKQITPRSGIANNQDLHCNLIARTIRHTPMFFERNFFMIFSRPLSAAAALALLALPATAEIRQPAYDAPSVKAECTQKWGSQFDMVKYCMDERRKGFHYFEKVTGIVGDFFFPTLNYCADKWGNQWDMTAYCTETNLNAMKTLNANTAGLPKDTADLIMIRCSQKWDPQWDMVAYCMKQQATAWKSINN